MQNKDFKSNLLQLKQWAFTLAETLIVMGIIGVVAALTLPNLNSSTGEKEKVAKVKKIYSNLNDALDRAQAVYGPYDEWKYYNVGFDRILDFLKVSKKCDTITRCEITVNDATDGNPKNFYRSAVLADGTTIAFGERGTNTYDETHLNYIIIDIDGLQKGANKGGQDIFRFHIGKTKKNGTVELNYEDCLIPPYKTNRGSFEPDCATKWVIVNGNMDYLKIGSDGKCPDGKTILDWTTNTTCK